VPESTEMVSPLVEGKQIAAATARDIPKAGSAGGDDGTADKATGRRLKADEKTAWMLRSRLKWPPGKAKKGPPVTGLFA
jgi:starvation-inducible DNA-binding protein